MGLPINIEELIKGQAVESERIEFKEGWNPDAILHTLCAFANDINNWGGGYIIIGIKSKNGRPVLPPVGLAPEQIDACQKKLVELCHKITPNYFPVSSPEKYEGKHILVLWVPGGETRPYKVPKTIFKKSEQVYYIRRFASTVKANASEGHQLYNLAAKIPFDDRINYNASIDGFSPQLIKVFLKEVGSGLYSLMDKINFEELCVQMQIARGSKEYLKPVNAGLLLFADKPEKYFKDTRIEVVEYQDEVGDKFTEKIFTGPIHIQLQDALHYIKNNIIKEEVRKVPNEEKAMRYFNYPYVAIEEALANAVYHKSYENRNPIEVNVRHNKIEILSIPGPVPPIDNKMLKKPVVVARIYRNRRIGDFLKELSLTEGRSTGFPKIRQAMKFNGSPLPVFETSKSREYFLTILSIHPQFKKVYREKAGIKPGLSWDQAGTKLGLSREEVKEVLSFCSSERRIADIQQKMKWTNRTKFRNKYINPLLKEGLLTMSILEKPNSPLQKYKTTQAGKVLLGKAGHKKT
ncbi:MAG: putative DNA binding domain-containing protein [Candidatus Omnitrophica bacterium]|nr:putative DNA binding domain-containing protein [Candidatus Omnitrophota bacterium]